MRLTEVAADDVCGRCGGLNQRRKWWVEPEKEVVN